MAYKNKMEIAMGVAIGSACQIALFVIPACVLIAWSLDKPLDLNFSIFDLSALFISTLVSVLTVQHGSSTWISGVMLVAAYLIVALGYWVHADQDLEHPGGGH